MSSAFKSIVCCILSLSLLTACDPAYDEILAESDDTPVVESRRIYEDVGEVVFHDYVPSEHRVRTYRDYDFIETTWTPVTIVEVSGMRKRYTDQETYELYWQNEKVQVEITDGLDGDGNVIECDFALIGRVQDE